MQVCCVYPAMSKSDKTTTKLSEKRKYVVLRESGTKKSLISNQNITNVEYKLLL